MSLTNKEGVDVRIKISPEADIKFREVSKESFNENITHRQLEKETLERIDKKAIKNFGDGLLKPKTSKKNLFHKRDRE